ESAINAESSLTGRNLEPWRALLATAGWLSSGGVRMTRDECGARSELVTRNSTLVTRMMALSVAYQKERPNVEAADLTALVIRALGMILGKITRDAGEVGDICEDGEVYRRTYYLLTSTITAAAQVIAEAHELDMNLEYITSRRT